MQLKRTQVYLEPEQHRLLKREAAERRVSMAELLRRVVAEHLVHQHPKGEFLRIVSLGRSGSNDVARDHDRYVGEAVAKDGALR